MEDHQHQQPTAGWLRVVHGTALLGDVTSDQARALADIARDFVGESTGISLTVDQNVFALDSKTHLAELRTRVACGLLAGPNQSSTSPRARALIPANWVSPRRAVWLVS